MKKMTDTGIIYSFLMLLFIINTYTVEDNLGDILLAILIMAASIIFVRNIGKKD